MTAAVKAKCPGCGDEEGVQASGLNNVIENDPGYGSEGVCTEWRCSECGEVFEISDWLGSKKSRTLTDADIEAIASRVVELMGESGTCV